MKRVSIVLGSLVWVLVSPLAAFAAKLSLEGRVELINSDFPVENARVTVTFHGHEPGIHEYTTQRTVRAYTDDFGNFLAEIKVPDHRYVWTHATVEIAETEMSKRAAAQSICQTSEDGGCYCTKDFHVNPLTPLESRQGE